MEKLIDYLPLLEEYDCPTSCDLLPLLSALIDSRLSNLKLITPPKEHIRSGVQWNSYILYALLIKNRLENL